MALVLAVTVVNFPLAQTNNAYAQQTRSPSILEFLGFKSPGTKLVEQNQPAPLKKKKNATKPAGRKKPKPLAAPTSTVGQDNPFQQGTPLQNVAPVDSGLPPEKMPDAKTIQIGRAHV